MQKNIEYYLEMVQSYGLALKNVTEKDQTKDICLAAVSQNGLALEYVKNQDNDICLAAVSQNGDALKYIKKVYLDKEICLKAVSQNGLALAYIKDYKLVDRDICIKAVSNNGHAIKYVINSDFLDNEMYLCAVKNYGSSIKYIKSPTFEICYAAINDEPASIEFIDENFDRYLELCQYAVEKNGLVLNLIKNQTQKICIAAIKQNAYAINYVTIDRTPKLNMLAIKTWNNAKKVKNFPFLYPKTENKKIRVFNHILKHYTHHNEPIEQVIKELGEKLTIKEKDCYYKLYLIKNISANYIFYTKMSSEKILMYTVFKK